MKPLFSDSVSPKLPSLSNQDLHLASFDEVNAIHVWTDGSCLAQRKVDGKVVTDRCGGWGFYRKQGETTTKRFGSAIDTTISRMEILAAIKGLSKLPKGSSVYVYTDSQYVQMSASSRLERWSKCGFRKADGRLVANHDLWIKLIKKMNRLKVKWVWVRGHSGNKGNEIADRLAGKGRQKSLKLKGYLP